MNGEIGYCRVSVTAANMVNEREAPVSTIGRRLTASIRNVCPRSRVVPARVERNQMHNEPLSPGVWSMAHGAIDRGAIGAPDDERR